MQNVQEYLDGVEDRLALEKAKLAQGEFTLGRALIMATVAFFIYRLLFGRKA